MWCRACGGTGHVSPSRNGLRWGDLLLDRETGEIVRVKWISSAEFVVESPVATPLSSLKVGRTREWRLHYFLLRVKFLRSKPVPEDPDLLELFC